MQSQQVARQEQTEALPRADIGRVEEDMSRVASTRSTASVATSEVREAVRLW